MTKPLSDLSGKPHSSPAPPAAMSLATGSFTWTNTVGMSRVTALPACAA